MGSSHTRGLGEIELVLRGRSGELVPGGRLAASAKRLWAFAYGAGARCVAEALLADFRERARPSSS
jgi:hypothetical protein